MLNKDEMARQKAAHPHDWSVIDSWAKYVATLDIDVLRDEIATKLAIDPTLIASRSMMLDLADDWAKHESALMKWQRELLKNGAV